MKIRVKADSAENFRTEALVLPLFADGIQGEVARRVDRILGGMIQKMLKRGDFMPKPGGVHLLYPQGKFEAERLVLVGLGSRKDMSIDRLRGAAGKALQAVRAAGGRDAAFVLEDIGFEPAAAAQAIVEGGALGLYQYRRYKTNEEDKGEKKVGALTIFVPSTAQVTPARKGAEAGELIAASAAMSRDMVSTPSSDMTPALMARIAKDIARKHRLRVRVLDRIQMQRMGMGALLGVASGSVQPPAFIIIEYRGGGKRPWIVLVGKSVTFDSGGISLKPPESMDRMKDDMAGGAAVLGAVRSAASLRLPLNIVGLLPATENMPSGSAFKPGDVLRTLMGHTIEIINTDAEGRLILADALAFACRYKPSVIIDIATLTGACRVALGQEATGMLGNNDVLKERMRRAGEASGERVWELPLWDGYYEQIKSDIADMKNTGGRDGGVITAACLLSKFVQAYPWVHLDIAGTAWTDKDRPYIPKGATGIGARLLTQFLRDLAKEGARTGKRTRK